MNNPFASLVQPALPQQPQPPAAAVPVQAPAQAPSPAIAPVSVPSAPAIPPEAWGLLNVIAKPESGDNYYIRYTPTGGVPFTGDQHPRIFETRPDGRKSSAAGRYGFIATTWDDLGGGPFTPQMQDARAWQLAQRDFKKRTGLDLLTTLKTEGVSPRVLRSLTPTWEGLSALPLDDARNLFVAGLTERPNAQQPGATAGAQAQAQMPGEWWPTEQAEQQPAAGAETIQRRPGRLPNTPEELPQEPTQRGNQQGLEIAQNLISGMKRGDTSGFRRMSRAAKVMAIADIGAALRGTDGANNT